MKKQRETFEDLDDNAMEDEMEGREYYDGYEGQQAAHENNDLKNLKVADYQMPDTHKEK